MKSITDNFKPVVDPTSKRRKRLLFRYDEKQGLIEIKGQDGLVIVNLSTGEIVPVREGSSHVHP